ncbi:hypothetical protein, partial [Victivallis lenta]|uniref:hypothetical protein n=1 Tax=Victivallis lenta TaxID=2606640 RepID=UPI003AB17291
IFFLNGPFLKHNLGFIKCQAVNPKLIDKSAKTFQPAARRRGISPSAGKLSPFSHLHSARPDRILGEQEKRKE